MTQGGNSSFHTLITFFIRRHTDKQILRAEDQKHQFLQIFFQYLFFLFKMFFQFFNQTEISDSRDPILKIGYRRIIGRCTHHRGGVSCRRQGGLQSCFLLRKNLIQTFVIIQSGSKQNLADHGKYKFFFLYQIFCLYTKHPYTVIFLVFSLEYLQSAADSTTLCIDLMEKFTISKVGCIHVSENRF